jgi:hypothetical protein
MPISPSIMGRWIKEESGLPDSDIDAGPASETVTARVPRPRPPPEHDHDEGAVTRVVLPSTVDPDELPPERTVLMASAVGTPSQAWPPPHPVPVAARAVAARATILMVPSAPPPRASLPALTYTLPLLGARPLRRGFEPARLRVPAWSVGIAVFVLAIGCGLLTALVLR